MNWSRPMPSKRKPPPLQMELLQRAAKGLRVLAHPQRLKLVELILTENHSVGELAEATDMAPAVVSQHLNLMRAHGLVSSQRQGRQVYYTVSSPQPPTLIDCIRRNKHRI